MHKSRELMILITFFSLWLTNYFGVDQQAFLAFALLFSVGLLHGANDLQLLKKSFKPHKSFSFYKNLAAYLSVVIAAFLLFYFLPLLTLIVFILVSGYHFGEQHWNSRLAKTKLSSYFYMSYGLFVLSLLFWFNPEQTTQVINELTNFQVSGPWLGFAALFFGINSLVLLTWYRFTNRITTKDVFFELFLCVVFAIVFQVASLVWAFAIYFIFWHSIPSIKEQVQFLYGRVTKKTTLRYLKSSALIWIISIAGLFIFDAVIRSQQQLFVSIFFSFIGAITFAHTFIIARMFEQKN